ncbi:hypothetical protein N9M02_01705 [Amylibacter sp.]|nr:hypothetical protein [Amylibacter sp.]
MCAFLESRMKLDIYFFEGSPKKTGPTFKCWGVQFKKFFLFFSLRFILTKYDYIIVSDLRQIAPLFFLYTKIFSSTKIIIEHEQRNFGITIFGKIITFILYLPFHIAFWRADLIRSPNVFSSKFLSYFFFKKKKIVILPLAVVKPPLGKQRMLETPKIKILWSGKRFWEKSGRLLIKLITEIDDLYLTILTSDKMDINHPRIKILPLKNKREFEKCSSNFDLCVYLSPTQSIYDTASLGLPTLVPGQFVPNTAYTENNFIKLTLQTDKNGVVNETNENYEILRQSVGQLNLKSVGTYNFFAEHLWHEYEKKLTGNI